LWSAAGAPGSTTLSGTILPTVTEKHPSHKKIAKYLHILNTIHIFAKYHERFYNMRRFVYIIIDEKGGEAFSNLSKMARSYPALSYSKVYRRLLRSNEITLEGYRILKLALR
jgi:hypothetical protein